MGSEMCIRDSSGNLRGERLRIESGDPSDAGTSIGNVFPSLGNAIANGRNDAQAGNDNSTLTQLGLRGNVLPATTRKADAGSGLLEVGIDVVHRLLDCCDFFGFLVGDFAFEFLLKRHHQFHRVE